MTSNRTIRMVDSFAIVIGLNVKHAVDCFISFINQSDLSGKREVKGLNTRLAYHSWHSSMKSI